MYENPCFKFSILKMMKIEHFIIYQLENNLKMYLNLKYYYKKIVPMDFQNVSTTVRNFKFSSF